MSTSQGAWSGIDRRRAQDFDYFEKGGTERRTVPAGFDTPNRQTHWMRFRHDGTPDRDEDTPRPIEWFVLLLFVLLLSAFCWGGIVWLVAQVIALIQN